MSIYTFHAELKEVVEGDLQDEDELIIFDASTNQTKRCALGQLLMYIGAAGSPGDVTRSKKAAADKLAAEKAAADRLEAKTDEEEDHHNPRSGRKAWKGE